MNTHFSSPEDLLSFIQEKQQGHILIRYELVPAYAGMVLGIGIIFDTSQAKYQLDLEWISFGLDLYAENLLENYTYAFNSLEDLLGYLERRYHVAVTDIPKNYKLNPDQFPNPIKDADQKEVFEKAWEKFQQDFRKDEFLDTSLHLVHTSTDLDGG